MMEGMMEGMEGENEEEDDLMMANWLHAVNRTANMPQYMTQNEYDASTEESSDSYDHDRTMDTQSSSEGEDLPTLVNRLERMHEQRYIPDRESDAASDPELPEWFVDRGFQYNGRVAIVAIPGLLLVMSLAGELLLTMVTIGGFIIHLLHSSGSKDKAFIVYMMTFIISQLCVLYAAVPLIWKSVVNLVLVWSINMFSAMTGVWLMLPFTVFRCKEPHLVRAIEVMLFSLYPSVGVVLLTWLLASLTSLLFAPYYLLISGFILLQVFTQPCHSSFIKPCPSHPQTQGEWGLLLEPTLAAVIALTYCLASPALFVVSSIFQSGPWGVVSPGFVIEWLFLCSTSVLLSSFLGIRLFTEKYGISQEHISRLRWACGVLSHLLLFCLLIVKGAHSHLLPLLPIGTLFHGGFGYFMKKKHLKDKTLLWGLGLLVFYVFAFSYFPWQLNYNVLYGSTPVQYIFILLFMNAVLALECLYAAIYFPPDQFGAAFIAQAMLLTVVEKVLWGCDLLPVLYILIVTMLMVYTAVRLYDSSKLLAPHAALISALHVTCLLTSVVTSGRPLLTDGLSWLLVEYISLALHLAVVLKLILFERKPKLGQKEFTQYMLATLFTCIVVTGMFFHRALEMYIITEPGLAEYAGVVLVVLACTAGKLTTCHSLENVDAGVRYLAPVLLGVAVTIVQLQPRIHPTLSSVIDWSAVVSMATLLLLPKLRVHLRSVRSLTVVSAAIGGPLGMLNWQGLYNGSGSVLQAMECVALSFGCIALALMVWTQYREKTILTLCLCLLSCVVKDVGYMAVQKSLSIPSLLLASATTIAVAGILKLNTMYHSSLQMTADGRLRFSRLPLVANTACVGALCLLGALCPWPEMQCYWYMLCGSALFLLQKDSHLFTSLSAHNHHIPVATVSLLSLLVFSSLFSDLWLPNPSSFTKFRSSLELAIVASTLPVWCIGASALWTKDGGGGGGKGRVFFTNERLVVWLTPLSAMLLVVASSNPSRLLGLGTVAFGAWLMTYKLTLPREQST